MKFPYTPIIAVFVGVTNIIPIFGPFLGAIPSAFLILLVSPASASTLSFSLLPSSSSTATSSAPKFLGETVGISSFWIVVAILVGGGFGGVLGMFLGVPVFACIHSAVSFLCESSLRKKGVTDDAIFEPPSGFDGHDHNTKKENPMNKRILTLFLSLTLLLSLAACGGTPTRPTRGATRTRSSSASRRIWKTALTPTPPSPLRTARCCSTCLRGLSSPTRTAT